jgi:signal transduction histidine kinase
MVGQFLSESESTSQLIEQLLTLARPDADTEQLTLELLDLSALIEQLEPGSRTLAESYGLHWSSEMPDGPVLVNGDRPLLPSSPVDSDR